MKLKSFSFLIAVVFFCNFSWQLKAKSETVLEEIRRTGLLKVAIREDAVPFGYRDLNNNLSGVCLDFFRFFRNQLKKHLNTEVILIKLYKSTLFNRFELVSNRVTYLECGPNTIRDIPNYDIQFSTPFFLTGTQLLIKASNQRNINLNGNLRNLNIGVLAKTSTQQLLSNRYPSANLVEFQGVTGRYRGIQALQANKIDGFASDSILLIGEGILQGLNIGKEYILVPKSPLDCEKYGLILPDNDPEWLNFVNSTIKNSREKRRFRKWFNLVLPEIESIEDFCRRTQVK